PIRFMQKFGLVFHRPLGGFVRWCQKLIAHCLLPGAVTPGSPSIMDDGPYACPVCVKLFVPARLFPVSRRGCAKKKALFKIDENPPTKLRPSSWIAKAAPGKPLGAKCE